MSRRKYTANYSDIFSVSFRLNITSVAIELDENANLITVVNAITGDPDFRRIARRVSERCLFSIRRVPRVGSYQQPAFVAGCLIKGLKFECSMQDVRRVTMAFSPRK